MKTALLFLGILFTCNLFASGHQVNGTIKDTDGNTIPGASIIEKGTTNGTISDLDGNFTLTVNGLDATLVISSLGYTTQEIELEKSGLSINITLLYDDTKLEEVVVVTTGYMKRASISSRGLKIRGTSSKPASFFGRAKALRSSKVDKGVASNEKAPAYGLLTAGEVNDFSKWNLWTDIGQTDLKSFQSTWKIRPQNRYAVQLKSHSGLPLINAEVYLINKLGGIDWSARTDNTGKAELWAGAFEKSGSEEKYTIEVNYLGKKYKLGKVKEFQKKINSYELDVEYTELEKVDIAFIVDATGSMGDEIDYLKAELENVIERAKDSLRNKQVRLATVFYQDEGDKYVTLPYNFTSDIKRATKNIQGIYADGGGDFPEAVDKALEEAVFNLDWDNKALARIAFLVLDAPPHNEPNHIKLLQKSIKRAAKKGIRLVPVTCSGVDKSTEYLMRSLALLSNGTYTFLTDDSGIGNPHIKPTTDEYEVELLNDLIQRVIYQYTYVPDIKSIAKEEFAQDTLTVEKVVALKQDTNTVKQEDPKAQEKISWKYYPNPTTGPITIEAQKDLDKLFIMDISGKILERHELKTRVVQLDLGQYPIGTYYICYSYGADKWLRGKVLKVQ